MKVDERMKPDKEVKVMQYRVCKNCRKYSLLQLKCNKSKTDKQPNNTCEDFED